jgi:hypothetical protein
MNRPRPCRICRKWFRPDPREGTRQRVCSSPACQRERHRRACAAWHARNPAYDREARLQKKLQAKAQVSSEGRAIVPPLARLDWAVARDAVGPEVTVVVEESVRVLSRWVRDAVITQVPLRLSVTGRHVPDGTRDAIATGPL